ncbi:MAG TPA: lysylphosphatidylglycerol synthase transmembrane domain-containing protein [Vicinamibacterales bacterium]|nr:lysylphosphatidylglycerol synthase transmembrane domain-containing protein [Vicinamibacterales bacterium]
MIDVVSFLRAVGGALAHARPLLVVAAVALHLAGLIITGERWRLVVVALGGRLTLLRSTLINLAGIFVRNATPTTGLGGDASRIALLRAEGVGLAQAAASFVYVRVAELPAIVAVVLVALPSIGAAVARSARRIEIAAGIGIAALAVAWMARHRLRARVAALREKSASVRIDRGAFAAAVAYASLAQLETLVRQIAVAAAFGLPLTFVQSATITAFTIAGGFVPTVGSVGAIEGSMVAGLMMCGATADTAVAITLVERAISYGLSTVLGAASLAVLGGRAILRVAVDRNGNAVTTG